MKRNRFAALVMVGVFALLAACTTTPGQGGKGTIEIWSSLPRQGSSKAQTDTMVNAIKMAIEEKGGVVGGYTIQYTDKDDSTAAAGKWDEATEIKNANDAVANDRLVGYLGTLNSGAAKLSIPILCTKGIVMVSAANTGVGLTKAFEPGEPEKYYPNGCKRNYHRVIPNDLLQGQAGALWASQLGAVNVWVVDDTEVYGKGLADVFVNEAPANGLTVTGRDGIDGKATDYKALADKIKAANVDLVYYGGITQNNAGQLWRDLRDAMPDVMLMGPDGVYESEFLEAAEAAAEGTLHHDRRDPAGSARRQGRRVRDQVHGEVPEQPGRGLHGLRVRVRQRAARGHRAGRGEEPGRHPRPPSPRPRRGQGDQGLRRHPRQVDLRRRRRYQPDRDVGPDHHRRRVRLRQDHQVSRATERCTS